MSRSRAVLSCVRAKQGFSGTRNVLGVIAADEYRCDSKQEGTDANCGIARDSGREGFWLTTTRIAEGNNYLHLFTRVTLILSLHVYAWKGLRVIKSCSDGNLTPGVDSCR